MSNYKQLVLIYNADSTFRGKVNYAIRKITASPADDSPACAACDITHGGLSFKQTPAWTKVKRDIEDQGWQVVQWHRDEVEESVKRWVQTRDLRYPVVLSRDQSKPESEQVELVATSRELADCAGNALRLFSMLQSKGLLIASTSPSL